MKKQIFAVALVAAASAASAQSSLSLYGVLDASIESVKGTNTVTRVSSGNLAVSRFGMRGAEDLGSGLKAVFVLESSIKGDTGAAGSNGRFFDRQAWIGLAGGFGELRLGRTDTSIGALIANTSVLGVQEYDDLKIAGVLGASKYRRADNAITYVLPTVVKGLTAQVQYATDFDGQEQPGTKDGRLYGLSAQYNGGGFGAGAAYLEARATNGAGAAAKEKAGAAYLSYDFGAAKLTGYYNRNGSGVGLTGARELLGARIDMPLGNAFALQANFARARDVGDIRNDADATIFGLKGIYNLSKRTAIYGLATTVSNDDNAALSVASVGVPAGERSSGLAFGVAHKF